VLCPATRTSGGEFGRCWSSMRTSKGRDGCSPHSAAMASWPHPARAGLLRWTSSTLADTSPTSWSLPRMQTPRA